MATARSMVNQVTNATDEDIANKLLGLPKDMHEGYITLIADSNNGTEKLEETRALLCLFRDKSLETLCQANLLLGKVDDYLLANPKLGGEMANKLDPKLGQANTKADELGKHADRIIAAINSIDDVLDARLNDDLIKAIESNRKTL